MYSCDLIAMAFARPAIKKEKSPFKNHYTAYTYFKTLYYRNLPRFLYFQIYCRRKTTDKKNLFGVTHRLLGGRLY